MNSSTALQNKFAHIYVEQNILSHPRTRSILSLFPSAAVIPVSAYTDVFDRRRQNHALQHASMNLILAEGHDPLFYPSSPVCQDFNNDYFYYCTPVMNCIYDCEYCWLKGMYASSNLVVFVNQEDYFSACSRMLEQHPMYLCICYENDLLALEQMLGYGKLWGEYTADHGNLTIELRTKAACYQNWSAIPVNPRIIFAFTLSPSHSSIYEHEAPGLLKRLEAAKACMEEGRPVRLCLDPMIYEPGWKKYYRQMVDAIVQNIDLSAVKDISVGTFRISRDYLHSMRMQEPDSAIVQYPYECTDGFYHLPDALADEMEEYLIDLLKPYIQEEKIFRWEKER